MDFKSCDAFFVFEPETGEQIAGFSSEKNSLYLLRNDGVYLHNIETESEECILENEQYEGLAFEYFGDSLYIFSNPYLVGTVGQLLFTE